MTSIREVLCPECKDTMDYISVQPWYDDKDEGWYLFLTCFLCGFICKHEIKLIWWNKLDQNVKRTVASLVMQTNGIIGSVSISSFAELRYTLTKDKKDGGYFVEWFLEVNYYGEIWLIFISITRIETENQKPNKPERLKITWTVRTIGYDGTIIITPVLFRAGVPEAKGRNQQLFYPPVYYDNMWMISDLEVIRCITGLKPMVIGTLPFELEFDTQKKIWIEKK